MKKLLTLMLLAPIISFSQEKNIVFSARLFPKTDKIVEFEKALTNHHMKFHAGEWKALVFEVISGPDAGAYQITMGPHSWEDLDNRQPTKEHDLDWNANVMPLVAKATSVGFAEYDKDLSTIAVGDFVEKIELFHVIPNVGKMGSLNHLVKRAKASWDANNRSVAVYRMNASGQNEIIMVTRFKNGWKEKGIKPAKSLKESLGGDSEYDDFMDDVSHVVSTSYGELLVMRKDLSSR